MLWIIFFFLNKGFNCDYTSLIALSVLYLHGTHRTLITWDNQKWIVCIIIYSCADIDNTLLVKSVCITDIFTFSFPVNLNCLGIQVCPQIQTENLTVADVDRNDVFSNK